MAGLVDFVSQPVLKGFAAASGILVSLHTIDSLLGLNIHPKKGVFIFLILDIIFIYMRRH
jgi:MFS superfamily sulfate permease-like transporter